MFTFEFLLKLNQFHLQLNIQWICKGYTKSFRAYWVKLMWKRTQKNNKRLFKLVVDLWFMIRRRRIIVSKKQIALRYIQYVKRSLSRTKIGFYWGFIIMNDSFKKGQYSDCRIIKNVKNTMISLKLSTQCNLLAFQVFYSYIGVTYLWGDSLQTDRNPKNAFNY
jgi:hypothetical protein